MVSRFGCQARENVIYSSFRAGLGPRCHRSGPGAIRANPRLPRLGAANKTLTCPPLTGLTWRCHAAGWRRLGLQHARHYAESPARPISVKTRATVLCGAIQSVAVVQLDRMPPSPCKVLLRMPTAGACRINWQSCTGATAPPPMPAVLGHEGAGLKAPVEAGVRDWCLGTA